MTTFEAVCPGVCVLETGILDSTYTPIPTESSPGQPNHTATANTSGEVVKSRPGGPLIIVESGPRWLVELAYQPPAWMDTAIVIIVVVTVGLAALGAYRHGTFDRALQRDLLRNGGTVVAVLGLGAAVRGVEPYWAAMLGAGIGGWALANGVVVAVDCLDGPNA